MSRKLAKSANLFKRLTGIVGVVGVTSLLGLPALSQSNTTPSQSSPTTAGEVCVIPRITINPDGSVNNMQGMSGNTDSSANIPEMSDNASNAPGTTNDTNMSARRPGEVVNGTADVQGTAGSMGEATGTTDTSARQGMDNSDSAGMMQGMIVCGTMTKPDATNRQSNQ